MGNLAHCGKLHCNDSLDCVWAGQGELGFHPYAVCNMYKVTEAFAITWKDMGRPIQIRSALRY